MKIKRTACEEEILIKNLSTTDMMVLVAKGSTKYTINLLDGGTMPFLKKQFYMATEREKKLMDRERFFYF
jgi:hypothetical protein